MTVYVSLSGGMDSTAAVARAIRQNNNGPVVGIGFDYGQRHDRELQAAARVAAHYGITYKILAIQGLSGSALLGEGDVPHGHYAADSMSQTVVQGRNLLFIANLVTLTKPGDEVWVGVHSGDHYIYPDCRPDFIYPLHMAIHSAYGVYLTAPWVHISKADIIKQEPEAPYELSWSCYEGGDIHCGRCGTCVERAEAFMLAGVKDPTVYADPDYFRTVV